MKNLKKCMVLLLCIFLITGCSNRKNTGGKGVNNRLRKVRKPHPMSKQTKIQETQ